MNISGARMSTEASRQLLFDYLSWQWRDYQQKQHDNYHWIIYEHYGRVNINGRQVQEMHFEEATSEIYLRIFIFYMMKEGGNWYYLRLFDFTVEDTIVMMFELNYMKVVLFMIGFTIYEIFSHNN